MSNLTPPDKWPGRTTGLAGETTRRTVALDGGNERMPFAERLS